MAQKSHRSTGSVDEDRLNKRAPAAESGPRQEGPSNELVLSLANEQGVEQDASWFDGIGTDDEMSWCEDSEQGLAGPERDEERDQESDGDPAGGPAVDAPARDGAPTDGDACAAADHASEEEQGEAQEEGQGEEQGPSEGAADREGEQGGGGGAAGAEEGEQAAEEGDASCEAAVQGKAVGEQTAGGGAPQGGGSKAGTGGGAGGQKGMPKAQVAAAVAPVDADKELGSFYEAYSGKTPEEHAAGNEMSLRDAASEIEGHKGTVQSHVASLCGQVDAQIASRLGQIQSAIAAAQGTVALQFSSARALVESGKAGVLAQIEAQQAAAVAQLEAAGAARTGELEVGFDGQLTRLEGISTAAQTDWAAAFRSKVEEIRGVGGAKAGEATSTGARMAAEYRGRGGSGIDGKRNRARAEAATDVAGQYAEQLRTKGDEAANEVAAGEANIPGMITGMVTPVAENLGTFRADAAGGLTEAVAAGKEMIAEQAEQARAAAESQAADALAQLAEQEGATLSQVAEAGANLQASTREGGEAIKAQLHQAAFELGGAYDRALADLTSGFEACDMPDDDDGQAAIAEVMADIRGSLPEQLAGFSEMVTTGFGDLDARVDEGVCGIREGAEKAGQSALEMANGAVTALQEVASGYGQACDAIVTGTDEAMGEMVTTAIDGATTVVDATDQGLQEQKAELEGQLDTVKQNVSSAFDEALIQLVPDIEAEAKKRADAIQPAWKRIVTAIVSVVVAVVVVIAVTALVIGTFGAGAVVAAVIAGAVAGVASTFAADVTMSLLTGNWNFSSPGEYLKAAVVGGLTGLIPGAGATGSATRVAATQVARGFASSALDQLANMVILGKDWNWGEFFANGAIASFGNRLSANLQAKGVNTNIMRAIFARNGGNAWNNFQRTLSTLPLGTMTSTQRSVIYRAIGDQLRDAPFNAVKKAIQDILVNPNLREQDPARITGTTDLEGALSA